jgi:SAM-dependent methyltransferase
MATDWEEHYQKRDLPWDKGAPSPGLLDFLQEHPIHGSVLVPGCGLGHDVRALAACADEVVGIDIAPAAVAAARALSNVGGERYQHADFFALPPSLRGVFDWVWEHTCFCAIDLARRPDYVAAAASALRQGGHLLAVFYLDPGQDLRTDGPPFETSLAELDRLFSPHFELIREWPPARTYRGRLGREWMRHLRLRASSLS